jgi:sulfur dioxygenase
MSKGGYIWRAQVQDPTQDEAGATSSSTSTQRRPSEELGMRQLYDEDTSTYTYLLWDKESEDAILIDPVDTQVQRDLLVATTLNLVYGVNTHCHADHITGTAKLKKKIKGLRSVISKASGARADEYIDDGDEIHFGNRHVKCLATPGHTEGCFSFLIGKQVPLTWSP